MFRRSSGEAKPGFVFLHFQPVLRQVAVVGCSDRKEESGLYPRRFFREQCRRETQSLWLSLPRWFSQK